MSNEEKSAMFAVLSEMEYSFIEIERVRDMLLIYDEWMEKELESFGTVHSDLLRQFPSRYKMLHSLMDAIQIQIKATLEVMEKNLEAGYDISRSCRAVTVG